MLQPPTTIHTAHHHSLQDTKKQNKSSATLLILPEMAASSDPASGDSIQQPLTPPFYLETAKGGESWRASGILHDFNNQLAIILSHCSIALTKLPSDSNARSNLERAVRGTRRVADLSSQLEVGMAVQDVEMAPLDLNQFVQETVEQFAVLVAADVTLETDYTPDLPALELNPLLIYRTLLNLLMNAVESLQGKSGRVSIATSVVTASTLSQQGGTENLPPGQYISLTVSDTGCGMDQKTVEQIFTPYYSTKILGMGLGLALTYHTIQLHKGAIYVQSTPNHGTVVHLLFPWLLNKDC